MNPPPELALRQGLLDKMSIADFQQNRDCFVTVTDLYRDRLGRRIPTREVKDRAMDLKGRGVPLGIITLWGEYRQVYGHVYFLFKSDAAEVTF